MVPKVRRLLLILFTSSGIVAASTLPASAGFNFANHCEHPAHVHCPQMHPSERKQL